MLFALIEIDDSEIMGTFAATGALERTAKPVTRLSDLHHYRICFDDHGTYDIICGLLKIDRSRGTDTEWESLKERYPIGARLDGTVESLVRFGVFIDLDRGDRGIALVSTFGVRDIGEIEHRYPPGTRVRTAVIDHDEEYHRIELRIVAVLSPLNPGGFDDGLSEPR